MIQHSSINCSHPVIYSSLRTYSPSKWKFIHFDIQHPISPLFCSCQLLYHHSVLHFYRVSFSKKYSTYKVIPYSMFFVWLVSLSLMPSKSIHVVSNGLVSFGKDFWLWGYPLFLGEHNNVVFMKLHWLRSVLAQTVGIHCSRLSSSCDWWRWVMSLASWGAMAAKIFLFFHFCLWEKVLAKGIPIGNWPAMLALRQ